MYTVQSVYFHILQPLRDVCSHSIILSYCLALHVNHRPCSRPPLRNPLSNDDDDDDDDDDDR